MQSMPEKSFHPQQVDIAAILNRRRKKPLPAFVTNGVARLIHQREINDVLRRYGHLEGVDFMDALIQEFRIDLTLVGAEHLPADPRALFISNHPLGGLDGICLTHLIAGHYHSDIRYIVNDLLLNLKPLANIFVPVNKYGAQARSSIQRMHEALESDLPVITFPAGLCSRLIKGQIQDPLWRPSFIKQARQFRRPIVPLFFHGRNSMKFYRIEQLRKALGIRFNIGTALLPHEMFAAQGSSFTVVVGEPIPYETLEGVKPSDLPQQVELIRQQVYQLKDQLSK